MKYCVDALLLSVYAVVLWGGLVWRTYTRQRTDSGMGSSTGANPN
jgi:hypothetical protein